MRTLTRTVLALTVAILLSLVLALPASAAQLIEYRGETSAPSYNRVIAYVLKKDSGRRFLQFIAVRSVLTCEDATTFKSSVIIGIGRLGEDGSFSRVIDDSDEFEDSATYVRVDGTIGFRHGSGTYLLSTAEVTRRRDRYPTMYDRRVDLDGRANPSHSGRDVVYGCPRGRELLEAPRRTRTRGVTMRMTRTAVSLTVALALAVTLAVPASAARLIHFDGKTSAPPTWRHVTIDVLKKDDGRRFLRAISIDFTLTCEDATDRSLDDRLLHGGAA